MPLNGFEKANRKSRRIADARRKATEWRDKANTAYENARPERVRQCEAWAAEWERRANMLLDQLSAGDLRLQ